MGRLAAIFLKKAENFDLQTPYLPLEQGIHAAVFPFGAALVHVPLRCFSFRQQPAADTAATTTQQIRPVQRGLLAA